MLIEIKIKPWLCPYDLPIILRVVIVSTELLLPSGSLKHLNYAFAYGADAVYAGQPRYSLRVRNNEFNLEKLQQGIQLAHQNNKQF